MDFANITVFIHKRSHLLEHFFAFYPELIPQSRAT